MSLLQEFYQYMVSQEIFLLPVFVMMFVFGGLLILTKGSAIAPFIYTLF